MNVIIGSVTADLLVQNKTVWADNDGDGFRQKNLVFTDTPATVSVGGNGGNSAYVLAGLGAPTALCGAVGQDALGDMLVNHLATRQVNLTGLTRIRSHATSTSTILMRDAANQTVLHHLGATAEAQFSAIPPSLLKKAESLLATSFPLMPRFRAGGFSAALAQVKAAGGITLLDIGPAIGEPVTLPELTPLLPNVDYLIANMHELLSLAETAVWQDTADHLLAAGAEHLIIKNGEHGVLAWSKKEQVQVSGFHVPANVSVGAGDSFNAGLLWALRQQRPLPQALRFGNAVAALVVSSRRGVLDSPSLAQVVTFLENHGPTA